MSASLAAEYNDLFAGQPAQISADAERLSRAASAIQQTIDALNDLVEGQKSLAAAKVSELAAAVKTQMSGARTRYKGTANALRTFSVELVPIQDRARSVIEQGAEEARRVSRLEDAQRTEMQVVRHRTASGEFGAEVWHDYNVIGRQIDQSLENLSEARRTLNGARDDVNAAANRAIAAITTAIDQGSDSFFDNAKQFFEAVGNAISDAVGWVASFLEEVLDTLIDILATIITIVVVVLNVVVVIAFVVLLVTNPLAALALGTLWAFAKALLILGGILVVTRVLSDVLKGTPEVRRRDELTRPDGGDQSAGGNRAKDPTTLSGIFGEAAEVDNLGNAPDGGNDTSTVVKITEIIDENGNRSYRVVLPSTQDWQALAPFLSADEQKTLGDKLFEAAFMSFDDAGSTGDLDSNMALMLSPWLATQYERAVFEAMEAAGITPGPDGDPVMLVGFSQGGIMAGHLAANRSDRYNFTGIAVSGAPIDHMPIPHDVAVLSVQHGGDPVPMLDLTPAGTYKGHPNWHTFTDVPPLATTDVSQIHLAGAYSQTLAEALKNDPAARSLAEDFEQFFVGPQDTAESQYYAWSE